MSANETILVSNSADLRSAFNAADGGETILLASNDAGYQLDIKPWTYQVRPFTEAVTIASADPDDPATFTRIDLKGVNNINFRDFNLEPTSSGTAFKVYDSEDISIHGVDFKGVATEPLMLWSQNGGSGLLAKNVDGLDFVGNTLSGFTFGINVFESDDVRISDTHLEHIQADFIRMAANQRMELSGNLLMDPLGVAQQISHADFIQVWSTDASRASIDVTISDNVLIASDHFGSQSIFINNEKYSVDDHQGDDFLHQNIAIKDNLILNGHVHGIYVHSARGLDIEGNVLLHNPDAAVRGLSGSGVTGAPNIRVRGESEDVSVTDNISPKVDFLDGVGGVKSGNLQPTYGNGDQPTDLVHILGDLDHWQDDPRFEILLDRLGVELGPRIELGPRQTALSGERMLKDTITFHASDFDTGGAGVAYHDKSGLQGGRAAAQGPDVELTKSGDIGWVNDGEWLEYTVNIAESGRFDLGVELATKLKGRSVVIEVRDAVTDEVSDAARIKTPVTENFERFELGESEISLDAGRHVIRMTFEGSQQNVRNLTLERNDGQRPVVERLLAEDTLVIRATEYDEGGQGVAYNDDRQLRGGTDGGRDGEVEHEPNSNIGYIRNGEWLEYGFTTDEPTMVDLGIELATRSGGRSARISFFMEGEDTPYLQRTVTAPVTKGWHDYEMRDAGAVELQAGEQIARVSFYGGSQNFRSVVLDPVEFVPMEDALF